MAGGLWRGSFATLVAALPFSVGATVYSKLEAGSTCARYMIPDVLSKDGPPTTSRTQANMVGLNNSIKIQINGLGFHGCALLTSSNWVIYSESHEVTIAQNVALPTLQFICNGIPTTTTTWTETATTQTTTTTSGIYTRLDGGARCADYGVPDVPSKDDCFETAVHFVGLAGKQTMELDNVGFTGCVYNTVAQTVLYGESTGVTADENMVLPNFEYVCNGIPTTTTTTTRTSLTATTTTTTTLGFVKLAPGSTCWDQQLAAVPSREACFGVAISAVGLAGRPTLEIDGIGFSGCIHNVIAGTVIWGVTAGVTPETMVALPSWEYICSGPATTPLYP